jgi:hypothetical protein
MRKITEKKPWYETLPLKNSRTYQFYRSKEGRNPQKIGERFKGKDRAQNVPVFEKGYCYNIKRVHCIPGTLNLVPQIPQKEPIAKEICVTVTHILLVSLIAIATLLVIRNLESEYAFKNLLFFLFIIVYIVFNNNYSVAGTSKKIVNIMYNFAKKNSKK